MEQSRMARIDSLLDPDSLITNDHRAQQRPLDWDPTETAGKKVTRLSYHLGGQWITAMQHAAENIELKEQLAEALLSIEPASVAAPILVNSGYENLGSRVTLLEDGGCPSWARRILDAGSYPSKLAYGIVDMGVLDKEALVELGFRKPVRGQTNSHAVILAHGVNHVSRSLFGSHTDRPRVIDHDRHLGWELPQPTMFQFRQHNEHRPDFVARIDVEALVGYARLRDAVRDLVGIDLKEYRRDLSGTNLDENTKRESEEYLSKVHEALDSIALSEDAHRLQAVNNKERRTGSIAGAFEDKIVVSKKVATLAEASPLNKIFGHVEFDEDIDQSKIPQMEQEIIKAMNHLPKTGSTLNALRVRKLGKYRGNTLGVYSPYHNAIALDDGKATRNGFSGMSAFMHEYAHYLDSTTNPEGLDLSMGAQFRPMLEAITKNVNAIEGMKKNYKDYLTTPTEAFARSFEYWASEVKGVESSLLATHEKYQHHDIYAAMRDNARLLDHVMSELFPDFQSFDTLDAGQWEALNVTSHIDDPMEERSDLYGMEYVDPIDYSSAEQMDIFDMLALDDSIGLLSR